MDFRVSRLRRGEIIAGISGGLLLVFLFGLTWYALKTPRGWNAAALGVPTLRFTGWDKLNDSRWLLLITPLTAIALAVMQATRRAPAIPVALSMIVTVLALVTLLVLVYRVLIDPPGSGELERRAGAYLGLASALGILYGAHSSLRQEGIAPEDGPQEIPTVRLATTRPAEQPVNTAPQR